MTNNYSKQLQNLTREVDELKKRLDAIAPVPPLMERTPVGCESLKESEVTQAAALLRPLLMSRQADEDSPALLHAIQKGGQTGLQITSQSQLAEESLAATARLAAVLGNEQRLRLMQILASGDKTSSELAGSLGLKGGPLYHHLKELAAMHLAEQQARNCYRLTEAGHDAWMTIRALHRRVAYQSWPGK